MPLHRRLYTSALVIFVLGAIGGLAVYFTASAGVSGSNYQIIGGQVYAINPNDSKLYNDQLARMGGRSAVYADQFSRWFQGLWHGPTLGLTIAGLCSAVALVLLWVAREFERDHQAHEGSPPGAS